jgi:branched-chain amino acid transport system permease protein
MRLLELDGVAAAYGAVRVIDHLDLDLDAGEVHALVGPNGSGKSTALRIAAGVLSASGGAVHVQGVPAADRGGAARRVRAGVARTLQRTVALGELDAATQVAVGARAREQTLLTGLRELFATARGRAASSARARVAAECLALVGLGDRAAAHTSTLDSAQQRLLQIARAAATGAPALLLDEPAAGMSAPQRTHLVGVLRALAARGHGVLLVEHDMALVARAADRVTVIAEGRVIASGPPDVVRRSADVARAYLGDDSAAQSRK